MCYRIWEYYKKLAEIIGINDKGETQGFSVSWFYDMMSEGGIQRNLNRLALSFLGDVNALNSLRLASEEDIVHMNERVRAICGEKPYEAQIDAVSNALLNDITIIQGPPGTGKTETIKNIVLSIRNLFPEAKIAIISANSEAINNAVDAVKIENELKDSYARLGNKGIRKAFKKQLSEENQELYDRLDCLCNEDTDYLFPEFFSDYYPIIFSTIHSIRKCVDIDEYDYVLVDECSQVPSFIGMIALSSAKHLVLLGDDEQLPPIHKDRENDEIENVPEIRSETPWYLDEGDNSFMKACKESFGEKCRSILLNEHYRCHPAIIGFCNRYVYENKLVTKTADDGKLPIRIRWYEGDYWESIKPNREEKAKNYNKMQIEVFVEDELPEILGLLENENEYSICVLSPYRYQLELLKERLDEALDATDSVIENRVEDEQPGVNDIAQLTIHKAQGRGYDRVYIMPVEDAGKTPWSQKKELINVAVSRAKKELCVITSSTWMSKELQIKFTGNYVNNSGTGDQCYIKDFLEYVEQEQKNRNVAGGYGFVKTSIDSIFARIPFYRDKYRCSDEKRKPEGNRTSAPEYCMKKALEDCDEIRNEFDILSEVPLKAFEGITSEDEEVNKYIEDGARFDFVIAKDDKVYAIIEVDGAYHRSDPETIHNDELKNRAVRELEGKIGKIVFLRLPTDGTTNDEQKSLVREILNVQVQCVCLRRNIMCMKVLNEKLISDKEYLENNLTPSLFKSKILTISFRNGSAKNIDYTNPYQVAFYMLKYAKYYALEYYWMYDLALRTLSYEFSRFRKQDAAVAYSFGCGSMIDGVSMLYAHEALRGASNYSIKEKLYYKGIDIVKWADTGLLEFESRYPRLINVSKYLDKGMVDFWEEILNTYANIFMFPKMLCEDLDDNSSGISIINQFCDNLELANLRRDYIILCVSYRGTNTFGDDYPLTVKIIDALRSKGYEKEPIKQSIIDTWVCRDYFDLIDPVNMVFKSRDNITIDYCGTYSDFDIPDEIIRYMGWGEILIDNCQGGITESDADGTRIISEICDDCGERCKRLRSYPRKNINSGTDHTCFQILPFRRTKKS